MSFLTIDNIDTNLEAYRLVYDPTRLLSLLYSKYGDIEDEYYLSYINQLVCNIPSHYNCTYKENLYLENIDEFLKRFYQNHESIARVPKLSDYYKNYLKFFCRPLFRSYKSGKLLNDYGDRKAEIFYKNNYADSINEIEEKENYNNISSSSLSSLDNITDNKIIFDKRTKKIIDENLNNEMCTITLTSESSRLNILKDNNKNCLNNVYHGCLISKRSKGNSSFEKNIYSLVNYQLNKKMKNKKKIFENKIKTPIHRRKKMLNSPSIHTPYLTKIYKKANLSSHNFINKDSVQKNENIKKSLYTIARKNYVKNNYFNYYKNENGFLSPKMNKYNMIFNNGISSKFEEFNKNRLNNCINYIHSSSKKYKTYNIINNNNKTHTIKSNNAKNSNFMKSKTNKNINTMYKNFSNLSESLNKFNNMKNKYSNITFSLKNNSRIEKIKKNKNSVNILIKSNKNENKIKKKINNNFMHDNNSNNLNKNKSNNKMNSNINVFKNSNLNINNNKPKSRHIKNKTFDFNTISQCEPLTKYNSNYNFDNCKSLLSNTSKYSQKKKKIASKFNLIKKPFNEVIKSPILSPQFNNKINNKISSNKSISHNKKKKQFNDLTNNSKNYNSQQVKNENDFSKDKKFNTKTISMTFSNENNNNDKIDIDELIKKSNKKNKDNKGNKENKINNNRKNIKNIHQNCNKNEAKKGNFTNIWKNPNSSISPLSNHRTNLNKIIKNFKYSNYGKVTKMENCISHKNKYGEMKSRKLNNNNYNTNKENMNINRNFNKTNDELQNMINIQNDINFVSRNKKQNTSKITITQSHNEINMKDIQIKSVKNLKSSNKFIDGKTHIKNMTCSNEGNYIISRCKLNCFGQINSSTEFKHNQIKEIIFKLNHITIKKNTKRNSLRNSRKKDNNPFGIKLNNKYNIRGMLSGDNIFNTKKIVKTEKNVVNTNNRLQNIDKNNVKANNTISHKERENSLIIINVNRNINLMSKNDSKNLQKLTKA